MVALAVIGAIVILAGKIADFSTVLVIDTGLILFVIIAGITMFASSSLIELFVCHSTSCLEFAGMDCVKIQSA